MTFVRRIMKEAGKKHVIFTELVKKHPTKDNGNTVNVNLSLLPESM